MTHERSSRTCFWLFVSWIVVLPVFGAAALGDESPQQVRGTLVDANDHPVANAKVRLYYHRSFSGFENEVVETVSSDKEGRFQSGA